MHAISRPNKRKLTYTDTAWCFLAVRGWRLVAVALPPIHWPAIKAANGPQSARFFASATLGLGEPVDTTTKPWRTIGAAASRRCYAADSIKRMLGGTRRRRGARELIPQRSATPRFTAQVEMIAQQHTDRRTQVRESLRYNQMD